MEGVHGYPRVYSVIGKREGIYTDGYEVVEGSLSRETDLAEVRIQLGPQIHQI